MPENMEAPIRRGISQLDVWAAADAVVAEGRRPTIDAVRQQLGRGSPNTVMAHLDSWFAHLADRLNGAGPAAPTLPGPVAAAAIRLWEAALASARTSVVDELANQRSALESEQATLRAASRALDGRAAEIDARLEAAHTAARTASEERAAADRREALAIERIGRLENQAIRLTRELEQISTDKRALHDELGALRRAADEERAKTDERLAGEERHWRGEVERARGELRDARSRADASEDEHRRSSKAATAQREALEAHVDSLRGELGQTQTTLASVTAERDLLRQQLHSIRPSLGRGKTRFKPMLRKGTTRA